MTTDEFRSLIDQPYDLLRSFDGHEAAYVGWESEWLVDTAELETADLTDQSICRLGGLVLARKLQSAESLDDRFVAFDSDHVWLPLREVWTWWHDGNPVDGRSDGPAG